MVNSDTISTAAEPEVDDFDSLDDSEGPADAHIKHADSIAYWDSIPSTDDGMLGGYPHVSRVDIQGSRSFLVKCGISASQASKGRKRVAGGALKQAEAEEPKADGEEEKEVKALERVVDCGAGYVCSSDGVDVTW